MHSNKGMCVGAAHVPFAPLHVRCTYHSIRADYMSEAKITLRLNVHERRLHFASGVETSYKISASRICDSERHRQLVS